MAFIRCSHMRASADGLHKVSTHREVMGMGASVDGLYKVFTHTEGDGDESQC